MEVLTYQQRRQHCEEETSLSSSDSEEEGRGMNMNIENQPPNLSSSSSSSGATTSSPSSKQVVFIGSCGFIPKILEVEVGVEVEFRLTFNVTNTEHPYRLTGASVTPELNFKSPIIVQSQEEFSFTPNVCGEISVSCPIYTAGITCQILVKASTASNASTEASTSCVTKKQSISSSSQSNVSKEGQLNPNGFHVAKSKDAFSSKVVNPSCTRLRVETYSFEFQSLSIKQGTTLEFIFNELEGDVTLACGWNHVPNEFDEFDNVVLSGAKSRSYSHIFATIGKFKVINKNFSFMSCIVDVLFDSAYFDDNLAKRPTKWYPIFKPSNAQFDDVNGKSLVRPHDLVAAPKPTSVTKTYSKIQGKTNNVNVNVSKEYQPKTVNAPELHHAVNFSQLSNHHVSPIAQSKDVTHLLESLNNNKDALRKEESKNLQETVEDFDIESGGGGVSNQLTRSQKRRIRKKIGKANAKDRQEDDDNEDELKPAATLQEARMNVFKIDSKRESEETETLISELLETSSTFSTPEKSYGEVDENVHKAHETVASSSFKSIIPSQNATVLPDWNTRPSKYRSFIDPNFRNTAVKNEESIPKSIGTANVSMELKDKSSLELETENVCSVSKYNTGTNVHAINSDDVGAAGINNTTSISAINASTDVTTMPTSLATQQQHTRSTEKKKKKEKHKKIGWQTSDSLGLSSNTSATKALTLEEIEEEQLKLDLLKIAELEAEEAEAKQKAAEEAKAKLKAAEEEKAKQKAAEEAKAKLKAAEEAKAKLKAAEEAKAKQKAAEEAKAKQKAAEEAKAKLKAAEEEKAKQKAAEEEKVKQKAAEEAKAKQKAAEEEKAKQKTAEEEKAKQKTAGDVSDLKGDVGICKKKDNFKLNQVTDSGSTQTKKQQKENKKKEKDEEVIKPVECSSSNDCTDESIPAGYVGEASSQSRENSGVKMSEWACLEQEEERDLQRAIEESKRFAAEEAQAMEELRRAEAKIKEAADARAKAEKRIVEAKAKVTRDTQSIDESINASIPDESILVESQTAIKTLPLNAAEVLLLQRFRAIEELNQGSNCHDILPSGKRLPFQVILSDPRKKIAKSPHEKDGKRNRQGRNGTKGRLPHSDSRGHK